MAPPPTPSSSEPSSKSDRSIQSVGAAADAVRESDKIMLVLAYLGIFALIPLLTVKDSDFVKWHARQGLVWSFGGGFALGLVAVILGSIPIIGWFTACGGWLGYLAVDMMAIMKALKGERWRIPVAADLSEKLGV